MELGDTIGLSNVRKAESMPQGMTVEERKQFINILM